VALDSGSGKLVSIKSRQLHLVKLDEISIESNIFSAARQPLIDLSQICWYMNFPTYCFRIVGRHNRTIGRQLLLELCLYSLHLLLQSMYSPCLNLQSMHGWTHHEGLLRTNTNLSATRELRLLFFCCFFFFFFLLLYGLEGFSFVWEGQQIYIYN